MPFSTQLANDIALFFNGTDMTAPAQVDIGLHTGDPGIDGANAEHSGQGYARTATGPFTITTVAEGERLSNEFAVIFPAGTGGPTILTHFTLWDNSTGQCLYQGALDAPVQWEDGVSLSFGIGKLTVVFLTIED